MVGAGWLLWSLGRLDWLVVDWADPLSWVRGAELEVAAAAIARLAGMAVVGWVVISTLAYVLARLLGAGVESLRWLSIGPLRRVADALLAGSLLVSTMAPAAAGVDPVPPPAAESTVGGVPAVDPAYVPVPAGPGQYRSRPSEESRPHAEEGEPSDSAPPTGEIQVVVSEGDHLWMLAENRLTQLLGRRVSEHEVAPYWVEVVEANRHRIRSGDPDLIFPGEEILLPPVEVTR